MIRYWLLHHGIPIPHHGLFIDCSSRCHYRLCMDCSDGGHRLYHLQRHMATILEPDSQIPRATICSAHKPVVSPQSLCTLNIQAYARQVRDILQQLAWRQICLQDCGDAQTIWADCSNLAFRPAHRGSSTLNADFELLSTDKIARTGFL